MSDPEKIASAEEAPTQIEKTEHDHVEEPFLEFTPEEEARVIRKLDYRLLPFLFLLYSLSVLDRSNLGNAKLAGLSKDIDIKGNRYNWLGTVFYIAYILSQWGLLGWKQFKPHNWVACVVFLWGFIATIQATVTGWGGLMVCRFFLAIAEAMYGPGVPLYFSYFYPREKIGFRIGCFISGSAMANAYGGALAYGISQAKTSIGAWRILFIVEGIPTCLIAIVAWFFLPDSLNSANFLNDREKAIAKAYVKRNQDADDEDHKVGVRPKELLAALKEPKNWIPPIMYFSCNVSFASLPLFVPTIISEMGKFTTIQSNGLSAPPYLLCFFTIIILSFLSDRLRVRGPFCFLASFVAAIGFILQATTKGVGTRYFGVFLSINIFASVALLLSWASNINRTETMRAGALAMMSTLGQCGPLLGTNVFPASEEPYYRKGMWISAAFCLVVSVLSIVLSVICYRENKQMERDGLIDAPGVEMADAPSGGGAVSRKYRQLW